MNKRTGMVLILALLCVAIFFVYRENRESMLEENAVSTVNKILDNSFAPLIAQAAGMGVARCSRVSIVEKIGSNTYTGVAILDNGNILDVKIEDLGDSIVVEVIE